MACSAFRSTTKRISQPGSRSGADSIIPRSKRDPSPSGRGLHRSTSVTDFSARYLSDCVSTAESRSSYSRSTNVRGGRRSVCPTDSESEWDSSSVHRLRRRWVAESEDERPHGNLHPKALESQQKGLKRTLSSQDLSQFSRKEEDNLVVLDKAPGKPETEDLAEEKTIKAVHDQTESVRLEPPVADVGMANFLDSMRSEVRRAVADIKMELEESIQRNGTALSSSHGGNRRESVGTVEVRSVADIQNEYSSKLEESERRVRELWSQIAVEERRCLELSKIVKELLPTPPPQISETLAQPASSYRRRSSRRKNSTEKQLAMESLDVEAQKYLEECVSISSSFECHGDSDESLQDKANINIQNDASFRKDRLADSRKTAAKPASADSDAKGDAQSKEVLVGSDGVVLPWLKWEAEASGGSDKNAKQGSRKHTSPRSNFSGTIRSSLNRAGASTDHFYRSGSGRKAAMSETMPDTLSSMTGMLLFTDDGPVGQGDHRLLDVDTVLLDRIQFKCRVDNGELLLCQGALLL